MEMVPKGFMCIPCKHVSRNCSHLPFKSYRPIVRHKDGVIEVKCEEFSRGNTK